MVASRPLARVQLQIVKTGWAPGGGLTTIAVTSVLSKHPGRGPRHSPCPRHLGPRRPSPAPGGSGATFANKLLASIRPAPGHPGCKACWVFVDFLK